MITSISVFTPGTVPTETYNKRAEKELEPTLNYALERGGKIVVVTGQTKIGKTVLVNKVVPDDKRISIQPEDLEQDVPLENVIAKKLGKIPIESKVIEEIQKESQTAGEFSGSTGGRIGFWRAFFAKAKMESNYRNQQGKSTLLESIFEENLFDLTMKHVIENGYVLFFDDFHYINPEKQRRLIHKLNQPLFDGAKIVMALIPSRNEDIITAERDMIGRTQEIKVPEWTEEELRFIPEEGFGKLNISFQRGIIDKIVQNSFNNPYLVQDICSKICDQLRIDKPKEKPIPIKVEFGLDDLEKVFSELNSTNSLVDKIERGKTSRGAKRKTFKLKEKEKHADTYLLDGLGAASQCKK
ncbi:MAG: ATP-binding protein [Ligilactobacillus sp.]|nr:ATP-binding protein [Ligilactobacillus sp.]